MSSAESTPEWNDRLRKQGWEEVGTFAAPGEKPSVRLWKHPNLRRRPDTPPRLTHYAIQVFAGTGCRAVRVQPNTNSMARSAVTGGLFGSSFYEIGFMDAKQNTYRAEERAKWSVTLVVGEMNECPSKKDDS